jgi:hypothetical protein
MVGARSSCSLDNDHDSDGAALTTAEVAVA